jgi:hypothetical protein
MLSLSLSLSRSLSLPLPPSLWKPLYTRSPAPAPPSPPLPPVPTGHVSSLLPYQLDTSRPSSRTNRTRRVPLAGEVFQPLLLSVEVPAYATGGATNVSFKYGAIEVDREQVGAAGPCEPRRARAN